MRGPSSTVESLFEHLPRKALILALLLASSLMPLKASGWSGIVLGPSFEFYSISGMSGMDSLVDHSLNLDFDGAYYFAGDIFGLGYGVGAGMIYDTTRHGEDVTALGRFLSIDGRISIAYRHELLDQLDLRLDLGGRFSHRFHHGQEGGGIAGATDSIDAMIRLDLAWELAPSFAVSVLFDLSIPVYSWISGIDAAPDGGANGHGVRFMPALAVTYLY